MLALDVRHVAKRIGGVQALDQASLHLHSGERLALVGPNGAGKTTLVRCISGRAVPDAGTIELFGQRLEAASARPQLGFVPQELALYHDLTALENLQVFGRFHGLGGPALADAIDWALGWTGLADRAGQLVHTFSGGMKRRVNIACGMLHRPRVVLLDEPTVGVDPQSRERIFEMLDQQRGEGTSILLTTHDLDEAEQQCDRIVIIDHGRVIAEGTLHDLIRDTVGVNRRVHVTLAEPVPPLAGFHVSNGGQQLGAEVVNVAVELPRLLAQIHDAGGQVSDVAVSAPSLHTVFIHLTGRDLRE